MAEVKTARVVDAAILARDTRWLRLELIGDAPLGFRGGQYIIIDSGLKLPNGKAGKRAYSIASCDSEQHTLELVVMRVGSGVVSNSMHSVEIGAELRFSGPWGKFVAPQIAVDRTLLLATDTGITAALGLVRSANFAARCAQTSLIWLRASKEYFIPDRWLRERLPRSLDIVHVATLPEIGNPARVEVARGLVSEISGGQPLSQAFLSGDGLVNYALLDHLVAGGVAVTRDEVESFFNMPKKSA